MKKDNCPYCHVELSDVQRNFSTAFMVGYTSSCEACEIPFKRITQGNLKDSGWYSTKIKNDELLDILSESQRLKISQLLARYQKNTENWVNFQKRKRINDFFYLFSSENQQGVCIVREDLPILDFCLKRILFLIIF